MSHVLLNFDKAGAEWLVVAYLAGDPNMLRVAKGKVSPHVITGSLMSRVAEDLVAKEAKIVGENTDPNLILELRKQHFPELLRGDYFLPRTMSIRQCGKKANHGLNYGEMYRTFALLNEIEEREAKEIIRLYRTVAYPGIPEWYESLQKQLRIDRTLTNCFGRRCYFMDAWGDELFRQAYAFLPQSTVGDMVNQGGICTINDPLLRRVQLLLQVHDSLVMQRELPGDSAWKDIAREVIRIGLDHLCPEIQYTEKFIIPTDLKIGPNWGNMELVALTRDEGVMADALRGAWERLQQRKAA